MPSRHDIDAEVAQDEPDVPNCATIVSSLQDAIGRLTRARTRVDKANNFLYGERPLGASDKIKANQNPVNVTELLQSLHEEITNLDDSISRL